MANKYAHLREKARKLRQQGYTLNDIMEMLNVPKTTLYGWIRDIEVEIQKTARKSLAQEAGTQAMQAKYAALREQAYQQGLDEAPARLADPVFRDFVNMYLAEGYKRGRNRVEISNSDYTIILLSNHWIRHFANPENVLEYRVQLHIDQDESEIKSYWADLLGIKQEQVKTQRKSNSGQLAGRKFRSQYGVLAIGVNDTYFRARMQAWMDILRKQWLDAVGR